MANDLWMKKYELAKRYYEKHGNLLIPETYELHDENLGNVKLGNWITNCRKEYKRENHGTLTSDKINLLNAIEMKWNKRECIDVIWQKKYELAKKYYETHGNIYLTVRQVVKDDEGNYVKLGTWIRNQRELYKKGLLSDEKIKLLNDLGIMWENSNKSMNNWMKRYLLVKEYYEEHGDTLIPVNYKVDNINLGVWLCLVKSKWRKGLLTDEYKIKLLEDINLSYDTRRKNFYDDIPNTWMRYYNLAKKYYEENNHLLIPVNYEVKNEMGNITKLGMWLINQRRAYNKSISLELNEKQIKLLEEIGMTWHETKQEISKNSNLLYDKEVIAYYDKNNTLPNPNYILKGINGNIKSVQKWFNDFKKDNETKKLDEEQLKLYENKGIYLSFNLKYNWLYNYSFAKKYYNEHGNLQIPYNYEIKDNLGNVIKLGAWINTQRKSFKEVNNHLFLNKYQIKLLDDIDMIWSFTKIREDVWMKNYKLAKEYFLKNGDLLVLKDYYIKDNEGNIINLGNWICAQRNKYQNNLIGEDEIKLLEEINMIWDKRKYNEIKKLIEEKYLEFQYGNLDKKQINELIENKILKYSDDNKIVKADAYKLYKNGCGLND